MSTVLFLGAGATKAVRGPMTDEILPAIYAEKARISAADPAGRVGQVVDFLERAFNVRQGLDKAHYPSLPLVMSLLDTALNRGEDLGEWDVNTLKELRRGLELGVFDVLEDALRKFPTNNHYALVDKLFPAGATPQVITTNYDLVLDSALMNLSRQRQPPGGLPEYHCALANLAVVPPLPKYGSVLKLHGSLNWLFCRTCQRLELGATESTRFLDIFSRIAGNLKEVFTPDGAQCSVCGRQLLPLLIAPSHLKDYRNPHLSLVWYEAQRMLRQATKVVFIGYSLPDDDVEVVYLLKRSLTRIQSPSDITVVEYCREDPATPLAEHPVGRRYRTLFGDVSWHAGGLDAWLATIW